MNSQISAYLYRGSCISAPVLLNLLKELGKEVKIRFGKLFIPFFNEFNKLKDTEAQMSDSIYHMTQKSL